MMAADLITTLRAARADYDAWRARNAARYGLDCADHIRRAIADDDDRETRAAVGCAIIAAGYAQGEPVRLFE